MTRVDATSPMQQIELLNEKNKQLEARCAHLESAQYATFSMTINRRPLLEKYTCGLVDPESKLLHKMLREGAVLVGATAFGKKHAKYSFKKKL